MAEIRINATGGVKLYDADDSHYAQIVAGTITSNVDAITLGHDTVTIADNLSLGSDSAVLKFGADGDTTLTHTDGTGLTLNSTNKLCFNDASQFIQGSSGTVLSIGATDEIDLTATAVDLNGTLNVSGVATFQSNPVFPDGGVAIADLDIDGGTDIGAAIVDADLLIIDDGAGGTNRKTTASRLKTYIGGGITEYDQWRTTTETTGSQNPVDNWERVDTDSFEHIGSGMTESSGVFTFPSTGKWVIHTMAMPMGNADSRYNDWAVHLSTDSGSSYSSAIYCSQFVVDTIGSNTVGSMSGDGLIDVTNASTFRVKLAFGVAGGTVTLTGATSTTNCAISFMRIGDT